MQSFTRMFAAIALPATIAIAPATASAQDYPDKPVTLVVPVSAGSGSDVLGRFVADGLSKIWGQPVVVENQPGAATVIGSERVAHSAADGYTLLFNGTNYTIQAAVETTLPFDPLVDLVPVANTFVSDFLITTSKAANLPTLEALIAKAKTEPLFYGATGTTSAGALAAAMLNAAAGIEIEAVNYKNAAEAFPDLASGRLHVYASSLTTMLPVLQSGEAIPVAVTSSKRSSYLADVPTTHELGYPDVTLLAFYAFFVPKGTPEAIVEKINRDIATVMASPQAQEFAKNSQSEVAVMSVAEVQALVREQIGAFSEIAAKAGMRAK